MILLPKTLQKNGSWSDQYFNGKISVDEFVNKLLADKQGDRNRRSLEQKHKNLFGKLKFKTKK